MHWTFSLGAEATLLASQYLLRLMYNAATRTTNVLGCSILIVVALFTKRFDVLKGISAMNTSVFLHVTMAAPTTPSSMLAHVILDYTSATAQI